MSGRYMMSGGYLFGFILTLSGTALDRPRHSRNVRSWSGGTQPLGQSTSHHKSGDDRRVSRQYRQTEVVWIRSHLVRREEGIRPRVSGGRRLTGAKLFRRYRADIQITRVLAPSRQPESVGGQISRLGRRGSVLPSSSSKRRGVSGLDGRSKG